MSHSLPLPSISARLRRQAERDPEAVGTLLRELAPGICDQIARDGRDAALLSRWGTSCNFEGDESKPIVTPPVLAAIGAIAGIELDLVHPHAGLLHTYGYLFSTVRTSFGFKRARWVRPGIARGLGLPRDTLSARPREGTLLANVTAVAARFVPEIALGASDSIAAEAPARLDPDAFVRARLTEQIDTVEGKTPGRDWELRTDLVWYRSGHAGKNEHALLLYSIRTDGVQHLVTAFPAGAWMAKKLRKQAAQSTPIRTRYNAWMPGLTGHDATGVRTWTEIPQAT